MTPLNLRDIRERCEKATHGPWCTQSMDSAVWSKLASSSNGQFYVDDAPAGFVRYEWDRNFIAHARTDLPALLDWVERARPLLESAMQLSEWQMPGLDYIPDPESTGLRLEDKIKQLLSELEP